MRPGASRRVDEPDRRVRQIGVDAAALDAVSWPLRPSWTTTPNDAAGRPPMFAAIRWSPSKNRARATPPVGEAALVDRDHGDVVRGGGDRQPAAVGVIGVSGGDSSACTRLSP